MTDLGTLPPNTRSAWPRPSTTPARVVGVSRDLNGNNFAAWLYQDGVMTNLNTLIPPGSPMFLMDATGINNRGQIAGFGTLPNGQVRGFLLTPCGGRSPRAGCPTTDVTTPGTQTAPATPATHRLPARQEASPITTPIVPEFSGWAR